MKKIMKNTYRIVMTRYEYGENRYGLTLCGVKYAAGGEEEYPRGAYVRSYIRYVLGYNEARDTLAAGIYAARKARIDGFLGGFIKKV